MEILIPNQIGVQEFKISKLYEEEIGEEIQTINPGKLGQRVKMKIPYSVQKGWILRRRKI